MLNRNLMTGLFSLMVLAITACGDSADKAVEQAKDKAKEKAADVVQTIEDKVVEKTEEVVKTEEIVQHDSLPATPPPNKELIHNVVYEQEMYKGWPYQEEARNLPAPDPEPAVSTDDSTGMIDKAKDAISDNTKQAQEVVVDKVAELTGQSKQLVDEVVEKAKDLVPAAAAGKEHRINAEARVFNPAIIYITPGDVIKFDNMTSHNSVSYIKPESAKGWGERGKGLGNNIKVQLNEPGIYGYACDPHIGFGMVGVVVVGDVSADQVAAAKQNAMDTLEGPYKRIIGKINKIQPTK